MINSNKRENDSDNNYFNGYFKRFKLSNHNEMSLDEIKEIAYNIGISFDFQDNQDELKNELYNRINKIMVLRDRLKDEQLKYDSVNSFKNSKPKLTVSSNIDSLEVSFFNCLRNKYIFKNIFSNFNTIYSYERLINIQYILDNFRNGIEIIRDKVKCGSFLDFGDISVKSCKTFQIFFQKFYKKKDNNNILFYKNLFNNYKILFDKPQSLLPLFLNSNKLSFLQFLDYYKLNKQDVERAINVDNQKFEFILNSYHNYKLYNYINSNYTLSNNLINISTFDIFSDDSFKFKQLIKLCKIIVLNKNFKNLNNSGGDNNSLLNNDQINSILRLFSSDQLNLSVLNLLYSLNDNIGFGSYKESRKETANENENIVLKNSIFKLIKMFYNITLNQKPTIYYFMINDPGIIKIFIPNDDLKYYLLQRNSRNEQFEYISSIFKKNQVSKESEIIHTDILFLIFSILQIDDLELIKYINENYKEILINIIKSNVKYIIQRIKSVTTLNWFYENIQDVIFKKDNHFWVYFQSKELIKEYENKIKQLKRSLFISCYIRDTLYNYKTNLFQLNLLIRAFKQIYKNNYKIQNNNGSIYKIDNIFSIYSYSNLFELLCDHYNQELFIKFFKYYNDINEISLVLLLPNRSIYPNLHKVCNWLLSNCIQSENIMEENIKLKVKVMKDKIITINLNSLKYLLILYSGGFFKELFSSSFSLERGNVFSYIQFVFLNGSQLELQKRFLNYYSNEIDKSGTTSINFEILLLQILNKSIINSNYPLIKFLFLNFPHIFKKRNVDDKNDVLSKIFQKSSICKEIKEIILNFE